MFRLLWLWMGCRDEGHIQERKDGRRICSCEIPSAQTYKTMTNFSTKKTAENLLNVKVIIV